HRFGLPPEGADSFGDLLDLLGGARAHHHVRARLGERQRARTADAAPGAGHQRDLAVDAEPVEDAHPVAPLVLSTPSSPAPTVSRPRSASEYVTVACATGRSRSPGSPVSEYSETSATASVRPSFSRRPSATRSTRRGRRRKLMLRRLVTASASGPMRDRTDMYDTASARAMSVGPDTVPPGRRFASLVGWRTRMPSVPTCSIVKAIG